MDIDRIFDDPKTEQKPKNCTGMYQCAGREFDKYNPECKNCHDNAVQITESNETWNDIGGHL